MLIFAVSDHLSKRPLSYVQLCQGWSCTKELELTIFLCKQPMDHENRTEHIEGELLMSLNSTSLFSETSVTVIDGSEKRNCWLIRELKSLHVFERCSKEHATLD